MEKYNYLNAIEEDLRTYISDSVNVSEFEDADELAEYLNEKCFVCDSVTGNASGSYTFCRWTAEEYLCHNFDLLAEACDEWDCWEVVKDGAEACDATIRCHLLGEAVGNVVCEYFDNDK